jgi:hypothetical protein
MAMRIELRKRPFRRLFLSGLSLAALASPAIASGCAASFEAISDINSLRVLAVTADKPYAAPGDTVTFQITYHDGYKDPKAPNAPPREVQILWLGGCFDPPGDEYYGCFPQLTELFGSLEPGTLPPPDIIALIGLGESFPLKLPPDILSRRPKPAAGPYYGIAYVFFAVCAGNIKAIPPESTGMAGSFPLGCFDDEGNRLGAESFVPGYTQVYSFEDGRKNQNPTVNGFTIDGTSIEEGAASEVKVERCDIADDKRNLAPGCGRPNPNADCKSYEIDIDVPEDVAEIDEDAKSQDGKPLTEVVWVDYFADGGSFDRDLMLVSDATTGITDDHKTKWMPPSEPGLWNLWAVVRDARGGTTILQRSVTVE